MHRPLPNVFATAPASNCFQFCFLAAKSEPKSAPWKSRIPFPKINNKPSRYFLLIWERNAGNRQGLLNGSRLNRVWTKQTNCTGTLSRRGYIFRIYLLHHDHSFLLIRLASYSREIRVSLVKNEWQFGVSFKLMPPEQTPGQSVHTTHHVH